MSMQNETEGKITARERAWRIIALLNLVCLLGIAAENMAHGSGERALQVETETRKLVGSLEQRVSILEQKVQQLQVQRKGGKQNAH